MKAKWQEKRGNDSSRPEKRKIPFDAYLEASKNLTYPESQLPDQALSRIYDFQSALVQKPHKTFFYTVEDDTMQHSGIMAGDVLVIEEVNLVPQDAIVLTLLDDEYLVRRWFRKNNRQVTLHSDNAVREELEVDEYCNFQLIGLVTGLARKFY